MLRNELELANQITPPASSTVMSFIYVQDLFYALYKYYPESSNIKSCRKSTTIHSVLKLRKGRCLGGDTHMLLLRKRGRKLLKSSKNY